jgi:hypothetical protein
MSSENQATSEEAQQLFVYFVLSDDSRKLHGGPYAPQKAREIKEGMERHIEEGDRETWRIPIDAESVELSPEPPAYRRDCS